MLAEAYAALAYAKFCYDFDMTDAELAYKRAIELNPSFARAHDAYAGFLAGHERFDEALIEIDRAKVLDPLSVHINFLVGWNLHMARQYNEAIKQYRVTIELNPNFGPAHSCLGMVYELKGMYQEAIEEHQQAIAIGRWPLVIGSLGHTYATAGMKDKALAVIDELRELSKQRYVSAYATALPYVGLDDKDQALALLGKAVEQHDGWLAFWLNVDPRLDSLRDDTRFTKLLRGIGFVR